MQMQGRHSTIRSWRSADVTSVVKHANNAKIALQLRDRFPHPYTASDARRFIEAVIGVRPVTTFAIDVDGEAVGGIGFSPGSDVERYSADIGYWLGEPFWGRGIATEALGAVTEYAFATFDIIRLQAGGFGWDPGLGPGAGKGRLHARGPRARCRREARPRGRPPALRAPAAVGIAGAAGR